MNRRFNTIRVLVVDDLPEMREIIAQLLVHEGFRTSLAADGQEAMNLLMEQWFDIVVSDVQMPRMDGFELLQAVHLRYPHLSVILMSAFADRETEEAALAWGAVALLQKPFEIKALTALILLAIEAANKPIGAAAGATTAAK